MTDQVCFDMHAFRGWATLLVIVFVFICWIAVSKRREKESFGDFREQLSGEQLQGKVELLKEQLYNCQKGKGWCEMELEKQKQFCEQQLPPVNNFGSGSLQLPPERRYISPKAFAVPTEFQNIGFVHGAAGRFPLFGRYREPGRSDKWEYYIVDESRNRLKIPFKTKNWTELYDGDVAMIPTVGEMNVSLYDYSQFRYNPDSD